MVVELDRDPALHTDSNVVEVRSSVLSCAGSEWITSLLSGIKILRTLFLTASRYGEQGTHQRKYGLSYTFSSTPSSSAYFQSLVGHTFGRPHEQLSNTAFVFSGNILGIKEESRGGVMQALWTYIKTHNLQDKVDRKQIHADAMLRPVCGHKPGRRHVLILSLDIWQGHDPIQSLTRAGKSLSCTAESGGRILHGKSIHTTPGKASSLGYRA
jgi:SWIB/MDM2 domain